MEVLRVSCEDEMILEFLKGEFSSERFGNKLNDVLVKLGLDNSIIIDGNILNKNENFMRMKIMKLFRGYPNAELFKNFPVFDKWEFVKLNLEDLDKIYFIDYDYWNELSNGTSKAYECAKNVRNGIEVYGVSNKYFLDGIEYLKNNKFPPIILITCNGEKYLLVEGHSRMTVYGLIPDKFDGTFAYVGTCSCDEMKKYDKRMT